MKGLNCTKEEALQILADDKDIDHNIKKDFDLSADKQKVAQQYTKTRTRKSPKDGKTVYKFDRPKEKKVDASKEDILDTFISVAENAFCETGTVVIRSEKGHKFTFELDGDIYEVTLTRKRKPKK